MNEQKQNMLFRVIGSLTNGIDEVIHKLSPNLIRWDSAMLNITGRCNSKCIMCNYTDIYRDKQDLDTEQWKTIIDKLHNFGIRKFGIAGGEPLVREDCFEIAEYCNSIAGTSSITTNGILIDEVKAKKMTKIFEIINISIDASNPELYKKVRGVDCFDKVIENVRILKSLGADVRTYYEINKYNYFDVIDMAQLTDKLGIEIVFALVSCGGFNNILTNDRTLHDEINFSVLKELISESLLYKHVSLWITLRDILQNRRPKKCYSTIRGVLIDSVGDVFHCCGSLPSSGNVLENDFVHFWEKYERIRSSLLNMKAKECCNCPLYTGDFEYLQEFMRKILPKPLRKNLKKLVSYLRSFTVK